MRASCPALAEYNSCLPRFAGAAPPAGCLDPLSELPVFALGGVGKNGCVRHSTVTVTLTFVCGRNSALQAWVNGQNYQPRPMAWASSISTRWASEGGLEANRNGFAAHNPSTACREPRSPGNPWRKDFRRDHPVTVRWLLGVRFLFAAAASILARAWTDRRARKLQGMYDGCRGGSISVCALSVSADD